jgi:hypothetical protein
MLYARLARCARAAAGPTAAWPPPPPARRQVMLLRRFKLALVPGQEVAYDVRWGGWRGCGRGRGWEARAWRPGRGLLLRASCEPACRRAAPLCLTPGRLPIERTHPDPNPTATPPCPRLRPPPQREPAHEGRHARHRRGARAAAARRRRVMARMRAPPPRPEIPACGLPWGPRAAPRRAARARPPPPLTSRAAAARIAPAAVTGPTARLPRWISPRPPAGPQPGARPLTCSVHAPRPDFPV